MLGFAFDQGHPRALWFLVTLPSMQHLAHSPGVRAGAICCSTSLIALFEASKTLDVVTWQFPTFLHRHSSYRSEHSRKHGCEHVCTSM